MKVGNIYQEVYELLCGLNPLDLQKIPKNILDEISYNRNKNYKTNINVYDLYNINNISEEAFKIYMKLDYDYLMTEKEKQYIGSD